MNNKWSKIIFTVFLLLVVVFQVSFLGRWKISGAYFNPVLAVLILNIFLGGRFREVAGIALAAGLIFYAFSGLGFGITAISLVLTVWLSDLSSIFLPRKSIFHFFLFIILSSVIFNASIFSLTNIIFFAGIYPNNLSVNFLSFSIGTLWGALANSIFGLMLFIPFKRWIIS